MEANSRRRALSCRPAWAELRTGVRLLGVLSACALTVACADFGDEPAEPKAHRDSTGGGDSQPLFGADWRSLSQAERSARIQQAQANAGPDYALSEREPGVWVARHTGASLRTVFAPGSVALAAAESADTALPFELSVAAWGCAGAMMSVAGVTPVVGGEPAGGVSYHHADFDEWYRNGPAGLEQGFTIRRLPTCVERGEKLQIRLHFSDEPGALADVSNDADHALLSVTGRQRLHYGEAFARDAAGQERAVRILGAGELALEIDAAGASLPLSVDPLGWDVQERLEIKDFDGAQWVDEHFGWAIATADRTAIVGSPGDGDKGISAGAAAVYARASVLEASVGPRWEPQQKLKATDGAPGDLFGSAVALSGNIAVVGAPGDDAHGSAYVFVRGGSKWTQQAKLVPLDLAAGDKFGVSVGISGQTVIVGAPNQASGGLHEVGAAYVYTQSANQWGQPRKFAPGVALASLHFGAAVATTGPVIAIGRDHPSAGGVDWFTRTGAVWNATSTSVTASVPHFGSALAMTDDLTAIGAYGDAVLGVEAGAVSTTSTAAPHTPLVRVTASDASAHAQFGFSVSLSDNTLVVGAPGAVHQVATENDGLVYVYSWDGSAWSNPWQLRDATYAQGVDFPQHIGFSVAAVDNAILLGAPLRSDYVVDPKGPNAGYTHTGAVLEEEYLLTNASPCNVGTDCFSGYCVEGVCCKSTCDGACRSCLAELKDPALSFGGDWVTGVCGEVKGGTDPKNGCTDMHTFCGSGDTCTGYGSCVATHAAGTPCGSASTPVCVSTASIARDYVCQSYQCKPSFTFDCEHGYVCQNGACGTNCAHDADCLPGFECHNGLCSQAPRAEGGSGGESGFAGMPSLPEGGGPTEPEGGSSGMSFAGAPTLGSGAGGLASGGLAAGAGGSDDGLGECTPACDATRVCNHRTGKCEDVAVTACGCRAAGGREVPGGPASLALVGALLSARRRRRYVTTRRRSPG